MNIRILSKYFLFLLFFCVRTHIAKRRKANIKSPLRKLLVSFVKLKIYLDFSNLRETFPQEILNEEGSQERIEEAATQAAITLENLLEINIDVGISLKMNDTSKGEWGLEEWDDNIFKEIKYQPDNYNYFIAFKFSNTINNIASAKIVQQIAIIPLIGIITINPILIKSKLNMPEYLKTLMLHQIIHLLGFHISVVDPEDDDIEIFTSFIKKGEDEENEIYYYLSEDSFPKVFEYARNYFNCPNLPDDYELRLELDEDGNVHWPKRYFLGELMTKFDYPEEQVLSGFTLAFLEDTSNIIVKYNYTGGLMRFGKHKGCEFFDPEIKCGDNAYKNIFANEFYLPELNSDEEITFEPSCSSGRLSKTVHKLYHYDEIPSAFEYVDHNYGGLPSTNYCPISEYPEKNEGNIYIGRCSEVEKSLNPSVEIELGETFSPSSFCVLSSLIKEDSSLDMDYRAVCYEMFCSKLSLTIKLKDNYIVCPRNGGKVTAENFKGFLLCPDYNLICTGEIVCNNLFDCIEKNSTEKEDTLFYEEGYEIKTTQDSNIYKEDGDILEDNAWELAEDDTKICPTFCMQCNINKKCNKCAPLYKKEDDGSKCVEVIEHCAALTIEKDCSECKEGYLLAQDIKDNPNICISNDEDTLKHYYKASSEDVVPEYYKRCDNDGITNCDECTINTVCGECKTGFIKVDEATICGDFSSKLYYQDIDGKYKSCSNKEGKNCNKCELNDGNFVCIECKNNYAFFYDETNSNECILKTTKEISRYYTNDGINYYPCFDVNYHTIENCDTCNTHDKCDTCIGEYISVNDKTMCILLSEKKYYKDTDNFYKLCSNSLSHCSKCENKNKCIECTPSSDYYLDNTGKCFDKNLYEEEHLYYKIGDTNIYGSCSIIENCEKCNSDTDCTSCKPGYHFILGEDNILKCQEINLDYYYASTQDGKTYYIKCDKDIPHCDKCSASNHCTECSNDFSIIEDDHTKCESLSSEKYYKETSSGKYRLCNKKFSKCEKCTLDESNFSCKQCEADYVLKHENVNSISCVEKSGIKNNNSFFSDDSELNYYSCNAFNDVGNCEKCFNKITCSDCKTSYKLVNQNTSCFLEKDIENSFIYHDNALNIYVRCSDLIQDCQQCSDRATCFNCQNGSVVEENNTCISKELVENNSYVQDETTGKYVSCSIIDNCITCSSKTICTKCQEGFNINDGICKMVSDKDKKLSTGAIVGIVFGCVGFLLIVAGVVYFLLKKFKKIGPIKSETNLPVNEEKVNNFENEQQDIIENNPDSKKVKKRSIHNA